MADPARKTQPALGPAPGSGPSAPTPSPQLRPRALRDVEFGPPAPNEPRRLQERIAAAFSARETTALEKMLMRLIILAATCVVGLSVAGQAGVLAPLVH